MVADVDRVMVEASSALLGRPLIFLRALAGGQHARTILATGGQDEYVVRLFPPGDPAVEHEVAALGRVAPLAGLVPRLVAHGERTSLGSIIVTTRVPGTHPAPTLSSVTIGEQMGAALATIHRHGGEGLREAPTDPPGGRGRISALARVEWPSLDHSDRVLTHYDYWCGNALWEGELLTGVVDWSGARRAPRGVDLAWCRLDLVLMGSPAAADAFLRRYESGAGVTLRDIRRWDVQAAAQAHDAVETWAPNYHEIGRPELTAGTLRRRLDAWSRRLVQSA